jgi:poly-gamma-glutamate synthesis protein (capsule biosynthesis protein)
MARTLLGVRAGVTVACVLAIVWSASPAMGGEGGEPFTGSVSRIDRETRRLMIGSSWRAGCPTPLRDLRLVRVTYRGFDARPHHGRLAVHRRWADEILVVFRHLYRSGFPIRRVRLVDRFGADDRASMRHDNTSAFNCRYVAGTTTWSQHAYGRAVDLNPVENPYVDGTHVSPRRGRGYLDRTDVRPGMIVRGDVVVRAFRRIGWGWGGRWTSAKDYQHFSANGR